jgi:hypothetical protein
MLLTSSSEKWISSDIPSETFAVHIFYKMPTTNSLSVGLIDHRPSIYKTSQIVFAHTIDSFVGGKGFQVNLRGVRIPTNNVYSQEKWDCLIIELSSFFA